MWAALDSLHSQGRAPGSPAGRDRHRGALPWGGAQFARRDLAAFLHAFRGRVHSVHEDTAVSVHGYVEQPAPWALDRIDQLTLPLDGAYRYNGLGSGVNVYVVDTVRRRALCRVFGGYVARTAAA